MERREGEGGGGDELAEPHLARKYRTPQHPTHAIPVLRRRGVIWGVDFPETGKARPSPPSFLLLYRSGVRILITRAVLPRTVTVIAAFAADGVTDSFCLGGELAVDSVRELVAHEQRLEGDVPWH